MLISLQAAYGVMDENGLIDLQSIRSDAQTCANYAFTHLPHAKGTFNVVPITIEATSSCVIVGAAVDIEH